MDLASISKLFSLFLIILLVSCECPTSIDTPRLNQPNEFFNLEIYNHSNINLKSFSNNIEISNLEPKLNQINKFIAGNSILSFKNSNKTILRKSYQINQNENYFLFLFSKDNYFQDLIVKNNIPTENEVNIRFINLENNLKLFQNNDTILIDEFKISQMLKLNKSDLLKIDSSNSTIKLDDFELGKNYNIITANQEILEIFISQF